MKRSVSVLLSALVVGTMMALPMSASAAKTSTTVVPDRTGDLGIFWDFTTCEPKPVWGPGTPVARAGYFDMVSFWFSQSGKTYTFGMELNAALPCEGDSLPPGIDYACWLIWIDPEPWNAIYNPVDTLYTVGLVYDGTEYSAALMEGVNGDVIVALPFEIDGSVFEVRFSGASIGGLSSFWWMPAAKVWWGALHVWDSIDRADPGAAPGQMWWDIPWPPP
ncbi:MAG: hypothetical protein JW880_04125 [Candidatus Thermoplasmatota archaeon]|nr:hypothetical protein [Candidatus Thermoplasmatota archaeon]